MFKDRDLQFQHLSFDPPLDSKRTRQLKAIVVPDRGYQLLGITLKLQNGRSPEIKVPHVLKYQGSDRTTMPLSQLDEEMFRGGFLSGSMKAG